MFAKERMKKFGGKRKKYAERSTEAVIIGDKLVQVPSDYDPDRVVDVVSNDKIEQEGQDGGTVEETGGVETTGQDANEEQEDG